nr:flagellar FlbD family protein [Aequitasia blattaphilus]
MTKINGEVILINSLQIEFIELIPESKIIMMNGKYHIVVEDKDEIMKRVIRFHQASHEKSQYGEEA